MDELTDFEKTIQAGSQFAILIHAYYEALIGSGFAHEDAMRLAIEYQKVILGLLNFGTKSRGNGEPS